MAKNIDLKGKVAIVTGATRGIGRAITLALTEAGANIVCVGKTGAGLSDLQKEIESAGSKAISIKADVSKMHDTREIVKTTVDAFSRIDILVNNAGIIFRKPIFDVTEEDWDSLMDINLKGVFFLTQEVGKVMIEQRYGKIINIASLTSFKGTPGISIYAISKAGLVSLTKCLAVEWSKYNINVNAIAPGYVITDLNRTALSDKAFYDQVVSRIPLGRVGNPADIGDAVAFLASDSSSYMTGETILIDGGYLSA